jgi:altered-inheritance-of-mitochondria protein 5
VQLPPINREVRIGLLETAKDRWNAELEKNVRTLQAADWTSARLSLEGKVSELWSKAFQKGREGVVEVTK